MKEHRIGIIMNGVTGRMGTHQHLIRSILAIRQQGGVRCLDGDLILPDPVVLVGRNIDKLKAIAEAHGIAHYSMDLDGCLSDPRFPVYFDAQVTDKRYDAVLKAVAAGKAIYCEKPSADTAAKAVALYRAACQAGVKNGVVQDKLWLPGLLKLRYLKDSGFFGRVLSVRGEFGYWVFDGKHQPCQRPSWNYRKEDGGGIILDMFAHWRYVIDHLFGPVRALTALGIRHIHERVDEQDRPYACTADDAAYATFELANGVVCHFNSSWAVRVRRDDLLTIQVDGTQGSAVAGLRKCWIQGDAATPRPVWNPDIESPLNYYHHWQEVPDNRAYDNAFKAEWELFLKHLVKDEPFPWTLLEGAKGVQLAELAYQSWSERRWVEVPPLS